MILENEPLTDTSDKATFEEMLRLKLALANTQSANANKIVPRGTCYYCDEQLADSTARWCDRDCRDDWEVSQKRLAVNKGKNK